MIEARSAGQDSVGGQSLSWSRVIETWASIEPLSGRQLFAAQAVQNETTHRVVLRYIAGIAPPMRVNFGGRLFDILAVRNVEERNRSLELDCREGFGE